jgi:hypothetical protein
MADEQVVAPDVTTIPAAPDVSVIVVEIERHPRESLDSTYRTALRRIEFDLGFLPGDIPTPVVTIIYRPGVTVTRFEFTFERNA